MTIYDACKEIENVSFIDPIFDKNFRGQSEKDRKQTLAVLTILDAAKKGEIFSKEYVDQVRWERDIAISQLNDIGKSLGEKMDDVKNINIARWKELRHGYLECSNCHHETNKLDRHGYPIGQDLTHDKPKYCPHCGAFMLNKNQNIFKDCI